MPSNEKNALIADIKRLMGPQLRRQPSFESYTANRIVDKLFIRLGIVAIIGLLGYLILKGSNDNRRCKC